MTRQLNRLTAIQVKNEKKKGLHHDGGGLYLQVAASGSKSWLFCYMFNGRERQMGLGSLNSISLSEARAKVQDARKLLTEKIDPLDAKKDKEAQDRLAASKGVTFKECAVAYIDAHKGTWKSDKTTKQWPAFFEKYTYPIIGKLDVADVDLELVLKILEPLWASKTVTAKRIRSRIERVLDWAKVRGYREGENPARWRGHLNNLLANPTKIHKEKHHPALPYSKVGDFMTLLHKQIGMDARALEFTILTAARTSEVTQAKWEEINIKDKVWTLKAERMKTGKEHRVPLTDDMIAVLRKTAQLSDDRNQNGIDTEHRTGWIFSSPRNHEKPLSNMAMLMLLRRLEQQELTVHGFRSTFRDWAAEKTSFPREVAEAALAHVVENKVEAAYMRSDLFEKRRRLMNAWSKFCFTPSAEEENGNILNFKLAN